jgi:glucose/arabinose dehydrogenase
MVAAVLGVVVGLLTVFTIDQTVNGRPTLLDGLRSPRGLAALSDGNVLISEVLGGRLLRMTANGDLEVIQEGLPATLGGPGGNYPTGASAAVLFEGTYYYVVGEFRGSKYSALYQLAPGAGPELLAGGTDRDGFPATRLTNPYDLVPWPEGGFLISDAGVNAVLHVSPKGDVSDYATFPRREVSIAGESYSFDVVPTGLTIGPDGAAYLASFTGFPYPQNAAYVYRLEDRNNDGDAMERGEVTVFAQGLSAATDLAFEEDGALLVTEFSTNMAALLDEHGIEQAEKVPGRLVRWKDGAVDVVADGLVSPTGLAIVGGRALVSEEFAGRMREIPTPTAGGSLGWVLPVLVGVTAAAMVLLGVTRWRRRG